MRNGVRGSGWLVALLMLLASVGRAFAHTGPPFPILENKAVGPVLVSIWANPDVGAGSFFVMLTAPKGGVVPNDLRVKLGVRPVSGRLAEKVYDGERQELEGQTEFKVFVPFDREEVWRTRLVIASASGGGEVVTDVPVTPPGYGRWDLLLYALPFLGVGVLVAKAVAVKRSKRKARRAPKGGPVMGSNGV